MFTPEWWYWIAGIGVSIGVAARVLTKRFGVPIGGGQAGAIAGVCIVLRMTMLRNGYTTGFTAAIIAVVASLYFLHRVIDVKWKE